jgi:hypothetical protein
MIRAETELDWLLVTHPDHAHLAGQFADAWGNAQFEKPHPYTDIQYAIYHHDDGWLRRDSSPSLTAAGKPEAFTSDLVGAYSAFEEIDLPAYLEVRRQATAEVAAVNPVAAVIVSMHTVNLLTEQADIETIRREHRSVHADFVASQQAWQGEIMSQFGLDPIAMRRGFEFLQCCDNLSLITCSGYDQPRVLRHAQPDHEGTSHPISCIPIGGSTWKLTPWPFAEPQMSFALPRRRLAKLRVTEVDSLRTEFQNAQPELMPLTLIAG